MSLCVYFSYAFFISVPTSSTTGANSLQNQSESSTKLSLTAKDNDFMIFGGDSDLEDVENFDSGKRNSLLLNDKVN
jgi:hypothetical protein